MADDTLIVLNSDAIAKALSTADRQMLAPIQQAVERWQLGRIGPAARYPAQNPASTYRRTGTLGRTWASGKPTWSASAGGFTSKLGNPTPYAPYVQGEHQGRGMGGWRKAEDIAQEGRGELERAVQGAVSEVEQQINGLAS